ncbi:sensor histidine kinase [Alkalibacillus almallahensis]|uniref:sensor histidine kinase n=1 Tax=Alkalibacillus almallahensis TaxID=1379154 RepID=UPI00141FDE31|nr:HAMP domain-containing sensor histidine kinase [Alkalibacillus almallahensis]
MFRNNRFIKGLLFQLTFINILMITLAIGLSSWAIYETACFLVDSMNGIDSETQARFEALLLEYLIAFTVLAIVIGGLLHYYLTRNMTRPIRDLIQSTQTLRAGQEPEKVHYQANNEVGELIEQYNRLINQLKQHDDVRNKMISDLSHELRTPVSNLNGYLYAMQSGDLEANQDTLHALYLESQRLKDLIEQVDQLKTLDYISTQSFNYDANVDIAEIIHQSTALFEWRFNQYYIPLSVDVVAQHADIQPEGIQQVINNLLDNALNYHDHVTPVTVEGFPEDDHYTVRITSESNAIPEEEREKIFERFYRLDPSRSRESGGNGLGLAIAKEIIERHQGKIGVTSHGNRNTFWFTIPIHK